MAIKKKTNGNSKTQDPRLATTPKATAKETKKALQAMVNGTAETPQPLKKEAKKKTSTTKTASSKKSTTGSSMYKYPSDCTDSISRKKFRSSCRAKLETLQRKLSEAETKAAKVSAQKALDQFKSEVYA